MRGVCPHRNIAPIRRGQALVAIGIYVSYPGRTCDVGVSGFIDHSPTHTDDGSGGGGGGGVTPTTPAPTETLPPGGTPTATLEDPDD